MSREGWALVASLLLVEGVLGWTSLSVADSSVWWLIAVLFELIYVIFYIVALNKTAKSTNVS